MQVTVTDQIAERGHHEHPAQGERTGPPGVMDRTGQPCRSLLKGQPVPGGGVTPKDLAGVLLGKPDEGLSRGGDPVEALHEQTSSPVAVTQQVVRGARGVHSRPPSTRRSARSPPDAATPLGRA